MRLLRLVNQDNSVGGRPNKSNIYREGDRGIFNAEFNEEIRIKPNSSIALHSLSIYNPNNHNIIDGNNDEIIIGDYRRQYEAAYAKWSELTGTPYLTREQQMKKILDEQDIAKKTKAP